MERRATVETEFTPTVTGYTTATRLVNAVNATLDDYDIYVRSADLDNNKDGTVHEVQTFPEVCHESNKILMVVDTKRRWFLYAPRFGYKYGCGAIRRNHYYKIRQ